MDRWLVRERGREQEALFRSIQAYSLRFRRSNVGSAFISDLPTWKKYSQSILLVLLGLPRWLNVYELEVIRTTVYYSARFRLTPVKLDA